jgi:hypothetical protein
MHRDGNLGNQAPGVGALGNGLIDQLADPRIHHMADAPAPGLWYTGH